MHPLVSIMVTIVVFTLIIAAATALVLTLGAAVAYLLPLSLFQATLLVIGSAVVSVLTALTLTMIRNSSWDQFICDDCRSKPDMSNNPWRNVHRNDSCYCGSGKKFKNCCGA